MIMTVAELKQFIATDEANKVLEAKLLALELLIRAYTNNNFQNRGYRVEADIRGGVFMSESLIPFAVGDTVMISQSDLQSDCLCTVKEITDDTTFTVNEACSDDDCILVTKVVYPMDVKLGVANMLKWQYSNGDKVGIQSETISRHSVTFFDMSEDNSVMGFPKALMGFFEAIYESAIRTGVEDMKGIGGNIAAVIQTASYTDNDIGEQVQTWADAQTLKGWLDLSDGSAKYQSFNAKIQESTHVFICDYIPLAAGIQAETSRMTINGKVYDITLIDNPMEMNQQLEIYLKYTGGQ